MSPILYPLKTPENLPKDLWFLIFSRGIKFWQDWVKNVEKTRMAFSNINESQRHFLFRLVGLFQLCIA